MLLKNKALNGWSLFALITVPISAAVVLRMTTLDLSDAAQESGYTRGHLGRMLRDGTLPNAGTASEPLVLRVHLPRKPGFGVDQNAARPASSRVQAARTVIEGDD